MTIGPYEVIHHTDTVSEYSFVVFWTKNGKLERAAHLGKRGGFKSMQAAVEAATNAAKYGTQNV
jgi:hypothetical protein